MIFLQRGMCLSAVSVDIIKKNIGVSSIIFGGRAKGGILLFFLTKKESKI